MKFKAWMVTAALSLSASTFAQGIPTYDAANVLAAMQQLLAWEKQYQQMYQQYVNQIQQIENQAQQIANISGTRNLGLTNNTITAPILSTDIQQQINGAANRQEVLQTTTQQLTNLLKASQTRNAQIQALMATINQTTDAKGIAELSARIQAEQVMATNESKEVELLSQLLMLQRQQRDEELRANRLRNLSLPQGAMGR